MTTDDMELVRQYAADQSESAFAALVSRRTNLVYSAALRRTGNPQLAEEITQAVFIILAHKAGSLNEKTIISGWLYRTACYVSGHAFKQELRRQQREQEAYMQSLSNQTESEIWPQIMPLLEEAMLRLGQTDRDALVLHYFEGRNMKEVGAILGASEAATKMRVNRAVEKLQKLLLKRGVTSTTATLAGAISANSVQAAPIALAKTATAVAIAKGAAASTSTLTLIKGALKIMAWTKMKIAIVVGATVVFTAAVVTPTVIHYHHQHASLYVQFKDKQPMLTSAQVAAYLKANGRTASSLLAAYRTSDDPELLKEAMGKYPTDPQVAFEAVFDKDLSPEQQRQWLNAFEQAAPDNALANYLSAVNYFKTGQKNQAMQELAAASGKHLDDYTLDRTHDDERAYLSAGYSSAEAEIISDGWLILPQLSQEKQLGRDLIALANAYSQSGDQNSAQASLQMAMNLGQNVVGESSNPTLISQLYGMSIETLALHAMNPNSPYGGNGHTVRDQINQINQQTATFIKLARRAKSFMSKMSDQDILNYENRRKTFGDVAALQWLVNKYGH